MIYNFKMTPFKHQLDYFTKFKDRQTAAIFAEMGTGKTKMMIDNLCYLFDQGSIDSALIIAPKGVYRNWTDKELPEHVAEHVPWISAAWDASPKKADKLKMSQVMQFSENLRIFVMNVEAFSTKNGILAAKQFLQTTRSTMMVVDESTCIKNPTSIRTKAIVKIARSYTRYRRIMSGEPAANSPLNLYSQFEFLDPEILGYSTYASFRREFAVMIERTTSNNARFQQVVGHQNLDQLYRLISPHSFIVKKADCLDLPDKIFQTVDVDMGPMQKRAYDQMKDLAIICLGSLTQVEDGAHPSDKDFEDSVGYDQLKEMDVEEPKIAAFGPTVTATMVITQLLRLHQVACGFMSVDGDETTPPRTVEFSERNDRMETMVELLQMHPGKAIIWATYRHSIKSIVARLEAEFGKEAVVHFFGETSTDDRAYAKTAFQDPNSPVRFFVGNPSTAGYGITLTQADLVIYYANSYDLEKRGQSEDRAHRIGQKKNVVYIDLVARGTVDEKILKVLRSKKQLSDLVTASNWRTLFE